MERKSLLDFIKSNIIPVVLMISLIGMIWAVPVGASGSSGLWCCPDEQHQDVFRLTTPFTSCEEIREYQVALKKLGYFQGKLNGTFDLNMARAVKSFQAKQRLKCDGVLGQKTRLALINVFETGDTHTTAQLSPKGEIHIVIDVEKKTLTIYDGSTVFKKYPVAVGVDRTPTPIGEWKVARKAKNWGTGFGTRWMGLSVPWGIYGIHGTNKPWSIGTEASHGCIRMFNQDVEEVYEWVEAGTLVKIIGQVYSPYYEDRERVHKGHRGTSVLLVQQGLATEGYLNDKPDGVFGERTEAALKKLQKDRGLEVTGQVDEDTWPLLGL